MIIQNILLPDDDGGETDVVERIEFVLLTILAIGVEDMAVVTAETEDTIVGEGEVTILAAGAEDMVLVVGLFA
jgi:hypothetical protein